MDAEIMTNAAAATAIRVRIDDCRFRATPGWGETCSGDIVEDHGLRGAVEAGRILGC